MLSRAVCPFVCPSVTRRYCVETANSSNFFSPSGNHAILAFSYTKPYCNIQTGNPNGGVEWMQMGYENRNFWSISRFISEMTNTIRPQLLWKANRKPYPNFRMLLYFQWPWVICNPDFTVAPLFDSEYLRNGTR